jgi:hypothetical protein
VAGHTGPLHAWGQLEQIDITLNEASPIPGHIGARLVGIKWDTRALPVRYSMNTTLDPVPNPLGAAFLSVPDARTALQASLDQWNEIRTSFISMTITGTTANPGFVGFDMINELSFRTANNFTAIASSPSVSLIADSTFVVGDDIDGDGDADVAAIATAADADNDGDIEFPAGFYKAGTILDNDVQFNTKATGLRFTVGDAALDAVTNSVDLNTTATHEFGHSLGLAHAMANQISPTNGDGATMFPFIDTGDPEAERLQRSLSSDDIAWASYVYPEGTASSGPAAIQFGDIPFKWVYGTIEGEIRHGVLNQPIAGASVFAVGEITKRVVAGGYSGHVRLSLNTATGGLSVVGDPAYTLLDGKYTIPVPLGLYAVGVEPIDGTPAAAGNINFTPQIGQIFGQMNFNEEFYNRSREAALETRPGSTFPVLAVPGTKRTGISIVTTDAFNVNRFGNRNFIGFVNLAPGTYYAMAIPASVIAAIAPGEPLAAQSVLYETTVLDASTVPRFAEAMITTGTISGTTATVNLAEPFDRVTNFIGQDNDFSPFFLKNPVRIGQKIRDGIAAGTIEHVFLVLRVPTEAPFPGVSAQPPLIGLDGGVSPNDSTLFGTSFISADGVTWTQQPAFNFRFSLALSRLP